MKQKITDALKGILKRSDEIVAMAHDGDLELPSLFTLKENNATIEACLALSDAVALARKEEIYDARREIEICREHVTAANDAICQRTTNNPLFINAIQGGEGIVFDLLLAGNDNIIKMAKIAYPFRWAMRRILNGVFSEISHLLAKDAEDKPIRVELVRKERAAKGTGRGKHTAYMQEQLRVFRDYLNTHPVCASYSVIDRARVCWMEHAAEWDAAASNKTGYSSYKALAQAV